MCEKCNEPSRRIFLTQAAALAAVGLAGWTAGTASAAGVPPTSLTPDEAIAKLKEGNAKFVSSPELCALDIAKRREDVAKGQAPWATVLTCADSRVHPELVFGGLNLGELFVCRNAGNMADTSTLGSIEYGAEHLGSPVIVVMGHEKCGAVAAACEAATNGATFPGSIGPMIDAILPAAKAMMGKEGDFVSNVVRESARRTAEKIATESEIVKHLAKEGKVKVLYAVYALDTGVVEFLG